MLRNRQQLKTRVMETILEKMGEVDNADVQEPLGKMMAKVSGGDVGYAKARLAQVF